ncbi:hypothetical protein SEVIR_6G137600v4 [Setaria viridis]|uniref:Uncharacterized protein n=2 Tax=Setaria TaxID=4554 RepID=K3YJT1_SETIT|nr:mitochondrial import inner membrane translocase subunit TIM17-3 [Setaria italica]XP_034598978.1 mitochondrial import inner membrane translocase subunit TIM17-3-like [Setaria viridis]RCV30828.1 hypothetical protein SETIT_6G127100v2 [Setaria italica]TKW09972.1 hypothetical protein SEVIR_6G137600v2 [Setaria viridis]TKW09973.1 hypothetical protein SEVIR_6G137600v2 [Setaria viridis]
MVKLRPYVEISDYRYRLIDYVGDGFVLGASFGSAFHFIRGLRNSPDGGRLAGGVRAVRTNVPRVAGRGGACLALFWAVESATCLARRRDDLWNSIAAGAATGGLFNVHRGAPAATLFALLGAASFVGLAGALWSVDLWNSRLFDHFAEVELNRGSPADPIVGSIEYRSKDHGTTDLFAMELNSEMAAKDDA